VGYGFWQSCGSGSSISSEFGSKSNPDPGLMTQTGRKRI
jgi:hypothetical protein